MNTNDTLWEEAIQLASRNYDIQTFRDTLTNGEVVSLAKNPELPGSMAHGATRDKAIENLKEARAEYIYSLLADGLPVPYPRNIATSTATNRKYVAISQRTVVGFGKVFEPNSREIDVFISFRGDTA